MSEMRVLLIGYGAIAKTVADAIAGDTQLQIVAILVKKHKREVLRAELDRSDTLLGDVVHVLESVDELVVPIDCALECAGHMGVTEHVPALLRRGIDVIVTSVGWQRQALPNRWKPRRAKAARKSRWFLAPWRALMHSPRPSPLVWTVLSIPGANRH